MSIVAFPSHVPPESAINTRIPGAYYHDCYAVVVPDTSQSALHYFMAAVANTPLWVNFLMALRNRIVRLVGLKDLGGLGAFDPSKPESAYVAGDRVGIFTLVSNTRREVLLGDSDNHLDVLLSVFKQPNPDGTVCIAVTTVVHIHNLLGRVYMLPVTPLHKLVARAVLSRTAG